MVRRYCIPVNALLLALSIVKLHLEHCCGFVPVSTRILKSTTPPRHTRVDASAEEPTSTQGTSRTDPSTENIVLEQSWQEILDSQAMREVRKELVEKYLEQGTPREVAEQEVTVFLADRERSEKYLEMRAYSAAQAEAGFETIITLIGGFVFGFLVIAGPKYFAVFKNANPDTTLPF